MKLFRCAFLLILSIQLSFGQSRAAKAENIFNEIATANPDVSISIAFVDRGKVYFYNYGIANRKTKSKVNQNSVFEIGSITKMLTGNLLAQAELDGKLRVDDIIDDYLPSKYIGENIEGKIKISDLASHQSGLPDFDFEALMNLRPKQPLDVTEQELSAILNDSTKLIDYGEHRYNNMGYALMGMILEKVYDKNFDEIVHEKILIPAKMNNTYTKNFDIKERTIGYDKNGVVQDYFNWNPIVAPAGLLKSTASDLMKFMRLLMSGNGNIGKPTAIMEQTYFKNTKREIGFGEQMEREGDDVFFYKTGDTLTSSTVLAYDNKTDWGLIILVNQNNSGLIRDLVNTVFEKVLSGKANTSKN